MNKAQAHGDVDLLRNLRDNPESALTELYKVYKQIVLGYLKKFGGDLDDHTEIYHDSVLAFYDIWLAGRYDATRASVSTLLCAIGKNKMLTRMGKQQKHQEWTELTPMIDTVDESEPAIEEALLSRVANAMDLLGEGCKEIIVLFYYQRCSVQEIVERLKYKNENVVKAHKSRCMKRLKELVQSTNS